MDVKYHFDEKQFKLTVQASQSMGHLLELLGVIKAGGNYTTMRQRIQEFNIDVSHWEKMKRKRQGWQKGKIGWREIPFSEILVENSTYKGGTNKLKQRLIRSGILKKKCYECQLTEWRGFPIPLELEHINGNRFDCRIENLTLLCPNCHTFTPTYRGKNKGRYNIKKPRHCCRGVQTGKG